MSIVEGSGIFKCTNESHKKEFETKDLNKFNEHLLEKGHTVSGRAPCAVCEKEVIATVPYHSRRIKNTTRLFFRLANKKCKQSKNGSES